MIDLGNIFKLKRDEKRKKLLKEIDKLDNSNYKKKQLQNKLEIMDKKDNPKYFFDKGGTYVKPKK